MEPQFPTVLTSSTRAYHAACPKKFFYSTLCGLIPRGAQANIHLHAGGAYAKALEATRKEFYSTKDYDAAISLGFTALVKSYGEYIPPPGEKKTFERMVAAFIEYLVRFPLETDHLKPYENKPRVEFSFAFEIPDCFHPVTKDPLLYGGTLDVGLVDWNGLLFFLDDKTTSRMGPIWRHQWPLRSQFTGYTVGLTNAMPELDIAGAIVRGMNILVNECQAQEVITMRPKWLVERWKERLVIETKRMLEQWHSNYWPNLGEENGECVRFRPCTYHTLCASQYPEAYIDAEFEVLRKNPLTHEVERDGDE